MSSARPMPQHLPLPRGLKYIICGGEPTVRSTTAPVVNLPRSRWRPPVQDVVLTSNDGAACCADKIKVQRNRTRSVARRRPRLGRCELTRNDQKNSRRTCLLFVGANRAYDAHLVYLYLQDYRWRLIVTRGSNIDSYNTGAFALEKIRYYYWLFVLILHISYYINVFCCPPLVMYMSTCT